MKRLLSVILALSMPVAVGCIGQRSTASRSTYDWLTTGEKSGELVVETTGDGARTITFAFNDRGRGPEITTRYRISPDGVPIAMTTKGKNYAKGDASETFELMADTARWTVTRETKTAKLREPALYQPRQASPEHGAILARALLSHPDRSMAALPAGRLSIDEIETTTFSGPKGPVKATLYGLTLDGPYPEYIWLDDNLELFGADYGWFAVTPVGMGEAMPLMKARQDVARRAKTAKLSTSFGHDVAGLVVIRKVRLFDSLTGRMIPLATVFVQDGVISAVYNEDVAAPKGARVIEGEGKSLLPGLWDMHAHVGPTRLFGYLAAGVLNVRDMANDPEFILELKRRIASGEVAAPDVYAMGFIDKKSEFAAPTGRLAENLEEALAHVDWYAQHGFRGIKLYSSIEPAWVEPIAQRAHARGLMVLGHIPAFMTAEQAIRAGYDEVTHINMLFLNFAKNAESIDTRTPQRFKVPIREGSALDPDGEGFAALLQLMKARNVAHDPTYTLFRGMFIDEAGQTMTMAARFADHLPESQRDWVRATEGFNKGLKAEGRLTAETAKQLVLKLHQSGIKVFPGTDTGYPGLVLLRELELLADAGIPPTQVLQLATIEPARRLGVDQTVGSVTPGKQAQLVLVNGDPTADLSALLRVDAVIKGTKMYVPKEIHAAFRIKPFVSE